GARAPRRPDVQQHRSLRQHDGLLDPLGPLRGDRTGQDRGGRAGLPRRIRGGVHVGVCPDTLVSAAIFRRSGGAPLELVFAAMVRRDLPVVIELERKAFSHPWTPEVFLSELRLPFSKIVLARVVGEPSGVVVGYLCRWLTAGVL